MLKENKIPTIFIVGSQMDIQAFNEAQDLIKINGNGQTLEDIEPTINSNFKSFSTSDELRSGLTLFPPLVAPFGEYSVVSNASSFLFQTIRNVDTPYPLVSFNERRGVRTAVMVGEGIWKWRIFDFFQNGNYDLTDEYVNKIVQFVSTKKDNRKFIAKSAKTLYKENESILLNAQLYNDNYELVNEPEVFLSVFGADNQEYQFIMNRNNDYYSISAGQLSPGNYRFNAKTNYNGSEYTDNGRFSVQEIQLESFDLEARHNVLADLAMNFLLSFFVETN